MESLILNASPQHIAQCCFAQQRTSFFNTASIQSSVACLHNLKPKTLQSNLFAFSTHGTQKRTCNRGVKASESEAQTPSEVSQQVSESVENTIAQTAAQVSSAVTPEDSSTKEGEGTAKYWSLRAASEGGKSHEIKPGDGILIGAAPDAKGSSVPLVIDIPTVSSSHAQVYSREKKSYQSTSHEYFVMDLGSTNGTYLNRSKLKPRAEVKLSRGDTLKFGDERAVFVVES